MKYRNIRIDKDNISGEESFDGETWYYFCGSVTMMKIYEYWTCPSVYAFSDGYGSPGEIPIQGMDWSGCRDSSEEAIARMLKAAENIHGEYPWSWETNDLFEKWKFYIGNKNCSDKILTAKMLVDWVNSKNPRLECIFCGIELDIDAQYCPRCREYKGLQPLISEWNN